MFLTILIDIWKQRKCLIEPKDKEKKNFLKKQNKVKFDSYNEFKVYLGMF